MSGERAALFATDPPYLVNYDGTNHFTSNQSKKGGQRNSRETATVGGGRGLPTQANPIGRAPGSRRETTPQGRRNSRGNFRGAKDWSGSYGITWDDADANSDLYERFIETAIAEAIDPGAPWYCWHASKRQAMLESVWNRFGAFVHQQIVWVKNRPVLTRSFYTWQHEPCLMGWIKGNQPKRVAGEPMRSTVWSADILTVGGGGGTPVRDAQTLAVTNAVAASAKLESWGRPDHPTPKPLILFETPMRQHTRDGDVVYEPFCGSGTQLIAAERLGRRCRAVEISPRYCDVIVRRWLAAVPPAAAPRELVKRYLAGVRPAAVPAPVVAAKDKRRNPKGLASVAKRKPLPRPKTKPAKQRGGPQR